MATSSMAIRFMYRGPIEAADELEETLVRSYVNLQSQLTPPYHLSTLTAAQHAHLTQALLCGILVSPPAAPSHITHLTAVTTDGYASFVSILLRIVNESYAKLLEQTRAQILWLFKQLIGLMAADVDTLCLSLLRQVAGGDLSPGNVWLASQLLEVMRSSWTWFTTSPLMLTTALYTYLRLLPDHAMAKAPELNDLKDKETALCVQILRDRLQDCLVIGRDLVRLLQDVTFIPDFGEIWRDLLNNPKSFKALSFADIAQLYVVRTPARYLVSRVTPDMESQIRFMLTHVKMGSQRRYQTWFAQRFLSSPESETLVCDLIRFICCVHHPTNQILQSDIVPRWAIVGWLLKCCKNNHVEANAKLALFYDWLFFMSKTDNIMNIEPAILLMVYSIPKYVDMTHSLLEFLFLLLEHYDPLRKDLVQKGVTASIDILVGKGVVRSLEPLSACNLVASWLREKLVFYFTAHCKSEVAAEGFKQGKPEQLFQQDSPSYEIAVVKAGASPGKDQDSGTDFYFTGAMQDHTPDVAGMDDLKSVGAGEPLSRKRRRPGATEHLLSEIQLNFDKLADALTKSQEIGMVVLEKLLWSFLSAGEQLFGDKMSKDIRSDFVGGEAVPSSGSIKVTGTDSNLPLFVANFASPLTDVLRKCGYELFCPLLKVPCERPEGDESMLSPTSTVLRLYVEHRRSHPLLLQLLLCWHEEGLPVGARFLCYVSRIAEEIESSRSVRSKGFSANLGQESHVATAMGIGTSSKIEEVSQVGLTGDGGEQAVEFYDSPGDGFREHRKNGSTSVTALRLSQGAGANFFPLSRKLSRVRDLNLASDTHARLRNLIGDAVKSYEEFTNHISKAASVTAVPEGSEGGWLSRNQNLQYNVAAELPTEGGATSSRIADCDSLDGQLFSDLETCLLWNTKRFCRVLPSIFRYFPGLALGRDEIVQRLVSSLDPQELSNFEFRLLLGEFAIFGHHQEVLAISIGKSLQWEFIEQQMFWRLLVAELQMSPSAVVLQLLRTCSTLLCPQENSEALSGLLLLLRYQVPTAQLVDAVLSLPTAFGRFAAVVLGSWVSSHHSQLLSCLQALDLGRSSKEKQKGDEGDELTTNNGAVRRFSSPALFVLLYSLEDTELFRHDEEEKGARIIRVNELKRALLKLAGVHDPAGGSVQASSETTAEYHQDRRLPTQSG